MVTLIFHPPCKQDFSHNGEGSLLKNSVSSKIKAPFHHSNSGWTEQSKIYRGRTTAGTILKIMLNKLKIQDKTQTSKHNPNLTVLDLYFPILSQPASLLR